MEQILPPLERQLRQLRMHGTLLAQCHPALAGQLGVQDRADPHVDRLVQGAAILHARAALMRERSMRQLDEMALEALFPDQLRPIPPCAIVRSGAPPGVTVAAARFDASTRSIELALAPGPAPRPATVDVCLDGEAAFCTALRHALLAADGSPFEPVGLSPGEALLPRSPGAHPGLALLREYFAFPQRFNMLRLRLDRLQAPRCTLRLPVPPGHGRMEYLAALERGHLRLGYVARAGLVAAAAVPLRVDGRQSEYILSAQGGGAIFSIDRAWIRHEGRVQPCGHLLAEGPPGPRWFVHHVAGAAPGAGWRASFSGLPELGCGSVVASFDLTCCEAGAAAGVSVRGDACRWMLHSLLALPALPLDGAALRQLMLTQLPEGAPAGASAIEAVKALDTHTAYLRCGRSAPLAGTDLRLQIDEAAFSAGGLYLFGQVMDAFFAESARINSFTRLAIHSARTGEELMRCKARNCGTLLE